MRPHLLFIGRALLFMVGFVAILLVMEWRIDVNHPMNETFHYHEVFHPTQSADVAILGSSVVIYGIKPSLLTDIQADAIDFHRIFNFALLGGRPIFYSYWYPLVFRPAYPKPKLVILGLDWLSLSKQTGRTPEADSHFLPLNVFARYLTTPGISLPAMVSNRFRLLQSGNGIRDVLIPRRDQQENFARDFDRGYLPMPPRDRPAPHETVVSERSPEAIAALNHLLDELAADHTRVILVRPPVYFAAMDQQGDQSADLAQIAKQHQLPLLDYNTDLVSDFNAHAANFVDWQHYSASGSVMFTKKLRADLQKILKQN